MGRPPCCDKVGIKKGPWTPEEDIILVSYIQEHGPGNWRAVPTNTGLMRCSKSCRLRWTNYLKPGIKRGNFTPHEEGMIIHLQALLGNKWAAIATYLPQRTDNDIKNYWNTHLKKKLQKLHADSMGPPQMLSSNHPFSSKAYGERDNHEHEIKSQTISVRQQSSHHHENSSVSYATSEENISRLLEGWMQSSQNPFQTTGATVATATAVGPNGYEDRFYRDFGQAPGEGISEATASIQGYRPQEIGNGEGWTSNGMMASSDHRQEMEAISTVDHRRRHHRISGKSSCDSSHKGSDSSGVMDHEEKAKIDTSTSPLSFLEKWLLEESSGGQVEAAAMELASIF